MLKDDVHPDAMLNHLNFIQNINRADPLLGEVSGVQQIYDGHIHGYAGRFTERVLEVLRMRPEVAYVEKDQFVHTTEFITQTPAPWVSSVLCVSV
jgi:cerevisin